MRGLCMAHSIISCKRHAVHGGSRVEGILGMQTCIRMLMVGGRFTDTVFKVTRKTTLHRDVFMATRRYSCWGFPSSGRSLCTML